MQRATAFVLHTFLSHMEQINEGMTADLSAVDISGCKRQSLWWKDIQSTK